MFQVTVEAASSSAITSVTGFKEIAMLKKSGTNPPAPLLKEASPRGKGMPGNPPQAKAKTGGSTAGMMLAGVKPAGRNSSSSTFRAPRGGESSDPSCCGYTKVKM